MKKNYLLLILLVFSSCGRSKQPSVLESVSDTITVQYVLDREDTTVYYPIKDNKITVDLNNPQIVSLFEYFKHIELIPLETNDEVLIGYLSRIINHQNLFFTVDMQQYMVQVFDEKGKFLYRIKKYGQGPGEYFRLDDMIINPYNGNFELYNVMGFIYSYDSLWNHIKTTPSYNAHAKNGIENLYGMVALNEKVNVFFSNFSEYKITYYDMEEKKVLLKDYEEDEAIAYFFLNFNVFYEYNGHPYFYRIYDNNVYLVDSSSLTKAYTWDFGKFNYNVKNLPIPGKHTDMWAKKDFKESRFPYMFNLHGLQGQNYRYVIAQIDLKNEEEGTLIYDKLTDTCKFIKPFYETVKFKPVTVTNEYVLSYCNHGEIENFIKEEMLDEDNRQKYKLLLETKEEMNPVIIKYFFK